MKEKAVRGAGAGATGVSVARFCLALLCVAQLGRSLTAQTPPKRYALLVSVDRHRQQLELSPVRYAANDANDLKAALESQGYEVTILRAEAATRRAILAELSRLAADAREEDSVILYLAGSAVRRQSGGNSYSYFLPYDVGYAVLDDAGLRLAHLVEYIGDIKCRQKLLLLDQTYAGDLVTTTGPSRGPDPPPPSQATAGRPSEVPALREERSALATAEIQNELASPSQSVTIIAALQEHDRNESERLGHSLLTAAVLGALSTGRADANGDGSLTVSELTQFVAREVHDLAAREGIKAGVVTSVPGRFDWLIARSFRSAEDVGKTVSRYVAKLQAWQSRGWISFETTIGVRVLLDKWAKAQQIGSPLAASDERLLTSVRAHIEIVGFPEETIAADLEDLLQAAAHSEKRLTKEPAPLVKKAGPTPAPPVEPERVTSRPALETRFGRFHALVIGIQQYKYIWKLETPLNDARKVAELLGGKYGFKVVRMEDATRHEIITALVELRRELSEADNLLVYYAGHGNLDRETATGYWLPVDAEEGNPANWVPNSDVTNHLKAMRARHVVVVADSCYSGTLLRGVENIGGSVGAARGDEWIGRMHEKRSRTALTAGDVEPVEDRGGGDHSVFAKAFIGALRDNEGICDGQRLFDMVKKRVVVNAQQTPAYSEIRFADHDGGDFVFVPQAGKNIP